MPTPANRTFVGYALAGFVGIALIGVGAMQRSSPFASHIEGAWPLELRTEGFPERWVGLLLVYAGVVVLVGAWYGLSIVGAGRPMRHLGAVLAAWTVPLFVMPPLFSRDVYAYAALGQLTSRGANPYRSSPTQLHDPSFLHFVDPLWQSAHAPYGPLFMDIGRATAAGAGPSIFAAVEGYRLVALVGIALLAVSIPTLARALGQPPSVAFVLAVLNPLVLLSLVAGAHNDALMLGLLVAGVALATRGHPVLGIMACALAAEVKIPGLIGVVFIGWAWAGAGAPVLRRARFVATAVLIGGVVMVAVSEVSGLGWGWLSNLSDPGTVVSWLDPATAVGLAASHLAHGLGATGSAHPFVVVARVLCLVAAAVIAVVMLVRSERYGLARSLGVALLAVVFLGPIVWPWYETWGIVFLALVDARWARRLLYVLTALGCVATVPAHIGVNAAEAVIMLVILAVLGVAMAMALAKTRAASLGARSGELVAQR